jgi:anti-sigma B factor antagonist
MGVHQEAADLIKVGPHLDVRNVAQVRTELNAALDATTGNVVLDMREVVMVDAAGLGMLTAAHLRAERVGRQVILRNCSNDIRRVFAVTHLNRVFHIDRSVELASASVAELTGTPG